MLHTVDTDKPILHEVYDMWDAMIKKVKAEIYQFEGKHQEEIVPFYTMITDTLITRWTKNCTPLHCLAQSLNPELSFLPFEINELIINTVTYLFNFN